MTDRARILSVIAAYTLIAVTVFPVFPHFVSPNEFSRWLLAAAVVEYGTVEVTALAPMFGPRFEDLSEHQGRLYSNKAPGAAFLGTIGYLPVRLLVTGPSPETLRLSLTAMRIVAATLPVILLAFAMTAVARSSLTSDPAFGVFVLLFATPLFAYGLLFFAHALTAAALFGAWALLFARKDGQTVHELFAGGLLGLATLSEYPLAVAILVILGVLLWERRFAATARVIAGGIPFAGALMMYNVVAFGSPFELSSAHERLAQFRELAATGLFGVGAPSPLAAFQMLAGSGKGLFLMSPVLLAGITALPAARRQYGTAAFVALISIPLSILLVYSGYPNWEGGWAMGPRYVTAAVPFLVFPLMLRKNGRLVHFLAGLSMFAVVVASLVFPFIPPAFPVPWSSFSLPLLGHGLVAPNVFHLLARPLALVAPFFIVAVAMVRCTRNPLLITAGALVGLVGALAAGQLREAPLPERLQRSYIEEVYFEQPGALTRLGIPLPRRLLARRDLELRLPPSSWHF